MVDRRCGKCRTTKAIKVRGLLCVMCNQGLGRFKDDLYLLEKAKQYLEKYGTAPAIPQ